MRASDIIKIILQEKYLYETNNCFEPNAVLLPLHMYYILLDEFDVLGNCVKNRLKRKPEYVCGLKIRVTLDGHIIVYSELDIDKK